jgi:hypothetical protein
VGNAPLDDKEEGHGDEPQIKTERAPAAEKVGAILGAPMPPISRQTSFNSRVVDKKLAELPEQIDAKADRAEIHAHEALSTTAAVADMASTYAQVSDRDRPSMHEGLNRLFDNAAQFTGKLEGTLRGLQNLELTKEALERQSGDSISPLTAIGLKFAISDTQQALQQSIANLQIGHEMIARARGTTHRSASTNDVPHRPAPMQPQATPTPPMVRASSMPLAPILEELTHGEKLAALRLPTAASTFNLTNGRFGQVFNLETLDDKGRAALTQKLIEPERAYAAGWLNDPKNRRSPRREAMEQVASNYDNIAMMLAEGFGQLVVGIDASQERAHVASVALTSLDDGQLAVAMETSSARFAARSASSDEAARGLALDAVEVLRKLSGATSILDDKTTY